MKGIVISNTGSRYEVLLDDESRAGLQACDPGSTACDPKCTIVTAAAKGNLRIRGIRTTNPVAVGDHVTLEYSNTQALQNSNTAYITAIAPRRNYIIRRASNLSKESHILAANIDQALLVCSLAHPAVSTTFIDRFLATAEAYSVPAIIAINKIDLLTEPDDLELLAAVRTLYQSLGYPVIPCSTLTGQGIPELQEHLQGKITLLSGNSGVGKSSIINLLVPEADATVASVSESHDTGTHTTTFSRMYPLPAGGWLIDTPGVRGFGTLDFNRHEVSHFFPEIFRFGQQCRFSDCLHTDGCPGCAVIQAINDHLIAQSRYASYLSILSNDTTPSASRYR